MFDCFLSPAPASPAFPKTFSRLLAASIGVTFLSLPIQLSSGPLPSGSAPLQITTTTSMVTDLVRRVGGEHVVVQGLMGAGVDPHLYKASAGDISKLQHATVVFYSGLFLEGKMQEVFQHLAHSKKHVYPVTASVPEAELLSPPGFGGHHDPHVWFDVGLWANCIESVVKGLTAAAPEHREYFEKQGKSVQAQMTQLHGWAKAKAEELPKAKRILITSHDAFNYFGRAYGFEVVGLQGVSTVDEASTGSMTKLVDFIKHRQVKAIFVESSVPPAAIQRISQDAKVKIGGELFSDAMGTPGQMEDGYDLGTYEGMIKHNLNTVVRALK